MKTSLSIISLFALTALVGCGDDDDKTPPVGEAGESGGGTAGTSSGGSSGEGGKGDEPMAGTPGEAGGETGGTAGAGEAGGGAGGTMSGGTAGTGTGGGTAGTGGTAGSGTGGTMTGEGGGGGEGGEEPAPFYACQGSDQQFVRRAIQGVLGRRPYSQAEVNLYTDLISEIDALDGVDPEELPAEPGKPLRHSRKVMLNALFQSPEYSSNWEELYRDFLRVQRFDEYANPGCYGVKARFSDPAAVAAFVRDNAPDAGGDGGVAPTMADVIAGGLALDDVSPIFTSNLFATVVKTYAGANGTAIESEIGRRRDFGAWFDAVYLNRDPVCLTCHNSEFSVTQSADPVTNRHYPIPALLEKALFGVSTGVAGTGEFEPTDVMHAPLKFARFVTNCTTVPSPAQITAAVEAGTIPPDMCSPGDYRECRAASSLGPRDIVCVQTVNAVRSARPWNFSTACGMFTNPDAIPPDLAGVNGKFGNITGTRSSIWDLERSLRGGFKKLRTEGLGADPVTWEVSDPDKAFAYMTVMTLVEKVWKEVTGTGLTIQTYFPRNAAARDVLQTLTDTFISSGYSHKALLETIYASPYLNLAPPDAECWATGYELPRIFDPWVTGEVDPVKRGNSVGDGALMLSGRTAARSAYGSLGWRLNPLGHGFPGANVAGWVENSTGAIGTAEKQFQQETGFFNKNTEVGFRGFDFQARLGFEDRFGRCTKLAPQTLNKDVIDNLLLKVKKPGVGTVADVVAVLKDRLIGQTTVSEAEKGALETILGQPLEADASALTDAAVRRACGAMITAPQALFTPVAVVPPDATEVPKLTLAEDGYERLCDSLAGLTLPDGVSVQCNGAEPLTVEVASATP